MPTGKFIQLQIFRYFQFYEFWGFFWSCLALYFTYRAPLVREYGETLNYVQWSRFKVISDHVKILFRVYSVHVHSTLLIALSGLCLTHKEPQGIGCAATFNHVSNSNVDVIADIFKNQFLTMLFLTDLILFRLNQDKSYK